MELKKRRMLSRALSVFTETFPNSVVGDLMMIFPDDIVLKVITCFSGEKVKFPKVETVWKSYRNEIIRQTLDVKRDRQTILRLANYFGISEEHIRYVHRQERQRAQRRKKSSVRRAARVAYRDVFEEMIKEAKEALK